LLNLPDGVANPAPFTEAEKIIFTGVLHIFKTLPEQSHNSHTTVPLRNTANNRRVSNHPTAGHSLIK